MKLETQVPARRAQWLGELIRSASAAGRDDLVSRRLSALAQEAAFTPTQRLQWARRCLEAGLKQSAAAAVAGGDFSSLTGDEAVEGEDEGLAQLLGMLDLSDDEEEEEV